MNPPARRRVKVYRRRNPYVTDRTTFTAQEIWESNRRAEDRFYSEVMDAWCNADPETDENKTDTLVNAKRLMAVVDLLCPDHQPKRGK